jgi:hypothetical protein
MNGMLYFCDDKWFPRELPKDILRTSLAIGRKFCSSQNLDEVLHHSGVKKVLFLLPRVAW